MVPWLARHDPCRRLIAVRIQALRPLAQGLEIGAEPGFQAADIRGFHENIITDMTMLVRLFQLQAERPSHLLGDVRTLHIETENRTRLFVAFEVPA